MKPFVKWIGGKGQVVEALAQAVPEKFGAYFEPMVGGGALFWHLASAGRLRGKKVHLYDSNDWLIETYKMVQLGPDDLLEELTELAAEYAKAPEAFYYDVRSAWNAGRRSAGRFLLLKKTSFNGLWRTNQRGELNMPWGKCPHRQLVDAAGILGCSRLLEGVSLTATSSAASMAQLYAKAGDVVYFDPPYYGTFGSYGPQAFDLPAHESLVRTCEEMASDGVHVLYTHQDSDDVWRWLRRHWAKGRRVRTLMSRRMVNRKGDGRQPVADLLVTSLSCAKVKGPIRQAA